MAGAHWARSDWQVIVAHLRRVALAVLLAQGALLPAAAQAQIGSERYASIVVEAATGRVLSAVDADEPRRPASLAKVMTAFLVFDAVAQGRARWSDPVVISANAARQPPSKIGAPAGSTMTLEQALLAIITKSANDVAVAIAEHFAGSEPAFARMMTLKARSIGMRDTVFRNASGLPDREQVTTARDMATLGRRIILDHPAHYRYFATEQFRFRGKVHHNHNMRMLSGYDGADGIKTGFIRDSGFNLLASAQRDGRRIVAVVFGGSSGPERDRHMTALLDDAFGGASAQLAQRPGFTLVSRANAAAPAQPAERAAIERAERQATRGPGRGPARDWAVQVGAFATRSQALAAARQAETRLGIARAEAAVSPVRSRTGGTLFRAQVTSLTAAEAREACAAMARRKQACTTIAPATVAESQARRG
jgi:D-alanyl-D-alanine carboxypeptidase